MATVAAMAAYLTDGVSDREGKGRPVRRSRSRFRFTVKAVTSLFGLFKTYDG